jgi:hypothetical protein
MTSVEAWILEALRILGAIIVFTFPVWFACWLLPLSERHEEQKRRGEWPY